MSSHKPKTFHKHQKSRRHKQAQHPASTKIESGACNLCALYSSPGSTPSFVLPAVHSLAEAYYASAAVQSVQQVWWCHPPPVFQKKSLRKLSLSSPFIIYGDVSCSGGLNLTPGELPRDLSEASLSVCRALAKGTRLPNVNVNNKRYPIVSWSHARKLLVQLNQSLESSFHSSSVSKDNALSGSEEAVVSCWVAIQTPLLKHPDWWFRRDCIQPPSYNQLILRFVVGLLFVAFCFIC